MPQTSNVRKLGIVSLIVASGILLQACATSRNSQIRSLTGACETFPRPEYQVHGVTRYDQQWVDETIESGVAACHWKRPAKRVAPKAAPPSKPQQRHQAENRIKRAWDKVRGW